MVGLTAFRKEVVSYDAPAAIPPPLSLRTRHLSLMSLKSEPRLGGAGASLIDLKVKHQTSVSYFDGLKAQK